MIREAGGVITRLGDETIGEMWSLADGKNVLNEIDPRFSENMSGHIADPYASDPFHVSADTDPKADRSKRPQDQDPDFLVHVVTETVVPLPSGTEVGWLLPTCIGDRRTGFRHHAVGPSPGSRRHYVPGARLSAIGAHPASSRGFSG